MLRKFIQIIFISSFLAACGAAPSADDGQPISNGTSSNAGISSTSNSVASSATSQTPSSSTSMTSSSTASSSSSVIMQSSSVMISSSSSSNSTSSIATQQVTVQWDHPTEREDGSFLTLDEIGGYEIRTKAASASFYTRYIVSGNRTLSYVLNTYTAGMTVEIAVFDITGIYSQFVAVN